MEIILSDEAVKFLKELKDKKAKRKLGNAIDEMRSRGIFTHKTKKLKETKTIYRTRVGRYRILFTINHLEQIIQLWLIEIKKAPEDYRRWIKHIEGSLSFTG